MRAPVLAGDLRLVALRAQFDALWATDTCFPPCRDEWTPERGSRGHCAVVALIVQDLCGGELLRSENDGEVHYWNRLPDCTEVDLTRDQFDLWNLTDDVAVSERSHILLSEDLVARYALFRHRWLERIAAATDDVPPAARPD